MLSISITQPGTFGHDVRPANRYLVDNSAMNQQSSSSAARESSGKARQKFVPLYSQDGQREVLILPGRHECSCQASRHSLINNCLNCGRIVCKQEGSGPCFTCKYLVCTKEEQEIINRKSKNSAKLLQKLMQDTEVVCRPDASLDERTQSRLSAAIEHKNKLLEYDKTVSRRTKVIDDQSDYFELESNKWLTKEQRKKISDKQREMLEAHSSRRNQKLSFDFAGRQILEEKPDFNFNIDELLNSDEMFKPDTSMFECKNMPPYEDLHGFSFDPKYEGDEAPIQPKKRLGDLGGVKLNLMRIQDRELQEMSDEGMCLSLHQPYASLIIAGIKKHEGRIWYTCYRGRLWIHAASKKVPTREEIMEAENAYRFIEGDSVFPESYPTGCLLGCVDLVDCLPQEEYREKFPDGESASPYVFICENPQELMIKFPMKGRHKIFKMDGKFHQAAKRTLKK